MGTHIWETTEFWAAIVGAFAGGIAAALADLALGWLKWKWRYSEALVERRLEAVLQLHASFQRLGLKLFSFGDRIENLFYEAKTPVPIAGEEEAREALNEASRDFVDTIECQALLVGPEVVETLHRYVGEVSELRKIANDGAEVEVVKHLRHQVSFEYERQFRSALSSMLGSREFPGFDGGRILGYQEGGGAAMRNRLDKAVKGRRPPPTLPS